ncbi:hypothetical protein SDC9_151689 [bioreactor metagenome]|uniref:Uncharacterized protein n=1 Tax=bioreactor metagenome TaxID=1076179 RepID=A0A645ER05_9ZZZZ
MQGQAQAGRLHVIHPDVTHADPGVVEQADEEEESQELDDAIGENTLPSLEGARTNNQQHGSDQHGIDRHDDGGGALGNPVLQAIMSADNDTIDHSSTPHRTRVSGMLTAKTTAAD